MILVFSTMCVWGVCFWANFDDLPVTHSSKLISGNIRNINFWAATSSWLEIKKRKKSGKKARKKKEEEEEEERRRTHTRDEAPLTLKEEEKEDQRAKLKSSSSDARNHGDRRRRELSQGVWRTRPLGWPRYVTASFAFSFSLSVRSH